MPSLETGAIARASKSLHAPGNPGMARVATCLPTGSSAEALARRPDRRRPGSAAGGRNRRPFRARGLTIVGPTAEAAQLEGSKIFAKNFLQQSGIPTAEFVTVETAEDASRALGRFGYPVVLKADGLAAGKGVVIAHDAPKPKRRSATLTGRLVIEEFLAGEEVSFIALCDGRDVVPLAPTQDHKAVFDGDQGPNTGGMGAYCDSPHPDRSRRRRRFWTRSSTRQWSARTSPAFCTPA